MKKIKSTIALLLVCTLFFSIASCGKDTADQTTTTTTQQYVTPDQTVNSDVTYSETAANSYAETVPTADTASTGTAPVETQAQVPETQNNSASSQKEPQTELPVTKVPQTTAPKTDAPQTTVAQQRPDITLPQETVDSISIHETENGKYYIYYPENIQSSKKTYPVLSWANGTMCPPDMYAGLFAELAKGGYIVIASDETMAADGTAQIAALDYVISLNNDSSCPAYKKVNTKQLGVIGHSQGGRSSVNAAVKDSRIKCVVSLAGSNYLEEAEPNSTPTLFIAGGKDMIVSPSQWIQPAYDVAKGPAVYASLNGAIHTTCCTDPTKYTTYILDWCDAWLKDNSKALNTFKSNGTLASDNSWSDFQCKGF